MCLDSLHSPLLLERGGGNSDTAALPTEDLGLYSGTK